MDQHIHSANMGKVAAFPLKLNLQLFAGEDDTPELEDEPEVEAEPETPEVEEPEETEEPEVVDPEPDKPQQDDKTNKAFAEMRRQNEALQKQVEFSRKYGQYGVFSEDDIATRYGDRGIYTVQQLDAAIETQRREEERKAWQEKGIDPNVVEEVVDKKLQNHPAVLEAERIRQDMLLMNNYQQVAQQYGDIVKSPTDIPPEVWSKWNMGQAKWGDGTPMSLAEVFAMMKGPEIQQKKAAELKQAAINKVNSKSHIKGSGGGNGDVETVEIPADTLRMYKALNPGKSMQEYMNHYKKSLKG